MNFLYPQYLYILIIVPFIFILMLFWDRHRYKKLFKIVSNKHLSSLLINHSKHTFWFRNIFINLAFIFFIISLARPRWGKIVEEVYVSGNNVAIVFDVSQSMLAEDLKPSRLSQAKHSVEKFIDHSPGDRISLVAFSSSAVLVSPLTTDHEALKMYLGSLDTNFISSKGTALSKGIKMAGDLLIGDQNVDAKRFILLVTDGEDHKGDIASINSYLKENNIVVYSLAVGLESGSSIPVYQYNGIKSGYLKDEKGNIIISKVNTNVLKDLSFSTGGLVYFTTFSGDEVLDILAKINNSDSNTKLKDKFDVRYKERYRYSLIPATVFFILGVIL